HRVGVQDGGDGRLGVVPVQAAVGVVAQGRGPVVAVRADTTVVDVVGVLRRGDGEGRQADAADRGGVVVRQARDPDQVIAAGRDQGVIAGDGPVVKARVGHPGRDVLHQGLAGADLPVQV